MKHDQGYIWLLGSTGFIGEALFRRLSARNNCRLIILLNRNMPFRRYEHHHLITGGMDGLDPLWLERFPPRIVFHMARPAGSNVLTRTLAALRGETANTRMVSLLARLEKPPVVVYGSGSLVYGQQSRQKTADETSPVNPLAFARYYYRNEIPWQDAAHGQLPDVRFARPGWIVGPGSWFDAFFWKPYIHCGMVPYYGDGRQKMSLIHIDDCALMMETIGFRGEPNQVLNVFTGTPITQKDFAELMADILDTTTFNVSYAGTKRSYGHTTAMALTSSIPMTTIHQDIFDKLPLQYPNAETILSDVIRIFKKTKIYLSQPH
jgi:nucleoside-diphosphate-sugar epimerase